MAEEKRERIERLKDRRERYRRCDRTFRKQVTPLGPSSRTSKSRPQQAMEASEVLIDDMVGVLTADSELMVHLMNDKAGHETCTFIRSTSRC